MVSQSGLWHSRRVLTPFWLALCQLHFLVNPPRSSACISRSFFATFAYFCLKNSSVLQWIVAHRYLLAALEDFVGQIAIQVSCTFRAPYFNFVFRVRESV